MTLDNSVWSTGTSGKPQRACRECHTDKPCPFCGGDDIRFDRHPRDRSPTGEVWSMCCYGCGATFPNCASKQPLLDRWNRRA